MTLAKPTDGASILDEEIAAQRLRERIPSVLLKYTDKARAEKYWLAMAEGMRPSPWYHDDPVADPNSLYLKRYTEIVKAAKESNLEAAKLHYLGMTMACFNCHAYVRDMRKKG